MTSTSIKFFSKYTKLANQINEINCDVALPKYTQVVDDSITGQNSANVLELIKRSIFFQQRKDNSQTPILSSTKQNLFLKKLNSYNINKELKIKIDNYYRDFIGIEVTNKHDSVRNLTLNTLNCETTRRQPDIKPLSSQKSEKEEKNKKEKFSNMKGQIIDMLITDETLAKKLNRKFNFQEEKTMTKCATRLTEMKNEVDRILKKERQFLRVNTNMNKSDKKIHNHHKQVSSLLVTSRDSFSDTMKHKDKHDEEEEFLSRTSVSLKKNTHSKHSSSGNLNFSSGKVYSLNSAMKEDRNISSIKVKLDLTSINR